jgi:hypothetical protein
MEFQERHSEEPVADFDAIRGSSALEKPSPLVKDDIQHEPDCSYTRVASAAATPAARCGCCSVVPAAVHGGAGGGDGANKPADPAAGPQSGGGQGDAGANSGGGQGDAGASGGGHDDNAADGTKNQDDAEKQDDDDKPATVTSIKVTKGGKGAAITIGGATYRDMYMEVSKRADLMKEGGKITPQAPNCIPTFKPGSTTKVKSWAVTMSVQISLPDWAGKANAGVDKGKFEDWAQGVSAHEDKHFAAFQKVTAAQVKPADDSDGAIDAALEAAWAANKADQDAVDASPPPPLAAPGGVEKVQSQSGDAAGDAKPAVNGAGADNHAQPNSTPAANSPAPAPSPGGEQPAPAN